MVVVSVNKTGTCTVICKVHGVVFDIVRLAKYAELDDECTGVAATLAAGQTNVARGTAVCKRQFPNQVTLEIVLPDNHRLKVKVFNVSLQVPGCRSVDDAELALGVVLRKYRAIAERVDDTKLTLSTGPFLGEDLILYSSDGRQIGHKARSGYYLKGPQAKVTTQSFGGSNVFVDLVWACARKRLWTVDGEPCGTLSILSQTRRPIKRMSGITVKAGILYKNDKVVGTVETVLDKDLSRSLRPWKPAPFSLSSVRAEYRVPLVHSTFQVLEGIDKEVVAQALLDSGYEVTYDPEGFHGVILRYLFPEVDTKEEYHDGKCGCDIGTRCSCTEASLMLFATGAVIATGLRSERQARTVRNFVGTFLEGVQKARE